MGSAASVGNARCPLPFCQRRACTPYCRYIYQGEIGPYIRMRLPPNLLLSGVNCGDTLLTRLLSRRFSRQPNFGLKIRSPFLSLLFLILAAPLPICLLPKLLARMVGRQQSSKLYLSLYSSCWFSSLAFVNNILSGRMPLVTCLLSSSQKRLARDLFIKDLSLFSA